MLMACNKRNTNWCPLGDKCSEFNPREVDCETEDVEFCCVDETDRTHDCKYTKVKLVK